MNENSEDEDRELRVVLPGVTALFAFLLTMPFSTGFSASTPPPARAAFFVGFLATGVAIVLLVGESAYHRLIGKARMLRTGSRHGYPHSDDPRIRTLNLPTHFLHGTMLGVVFAALSLLDLSAVLTTLLYYVLLLGAD